MKKESCKPMKSRSENSVAGWNFTFFKLKILKILLFIYYLSALCLFTVPDFWN